MYIYNFCKFYQVFVYRNTEKLKFNSQYDSRYSIGVFKNRISSDSRIINFNSLDWLKLKFDQLKCIYAESEI